MESSRYRFVNEKSFDNLHLSVKFNNLYKRSVRASGLKPSRDVIGKVLRTEDAQVLSTSTVHSVDINKSSFSHKSERREIFTPDELNGTCDSGDVPECSKLDGDKDERCSQPTDESTSPENILSSPVRQSSRGPEYNRFSPEGKITSYCSGGPNQSSPPGCDIFSSPVRHSPGWPKTHRSRVDNHNCSGIIIELSPDDGLSDSGDIHSSPVKPSPAYQPILPSDLVKHDSDKCTQAAEDVGMKPSNLKRGTNCSLKEEQASKRSRKIVEEQSKKKCQSPLVCRNGSRKEENKKQNNGPLQQQTVLTNSPGIGNLHSLDASTSAVGGESTTARENVKSQRRKCRQPHRESTEQQSAATRRKAVKGQAVPNDSMKLVREKPESSSRGSPCKKPAVYKENVKPARRKVRSSKQKVKSKSKNKDYSDKSVAKQGRNLMSDKDISPVDQGENVPKRRKSEQKHDDNERNTSMSGTIEESRTSEENIKQMVDHQSHQNELSVNNVTEGVRVGNDVSLYSPMERLTSESSEPGIVCGHGPISTDVEECRNEDRMETIEFLTVGNVKNTKHLKNIVKRSNNSSHTSEEYDITFVSNSSDEAGGTTMENTGRSLAMRRHWNILPLSEAIRTDTDLPRLHVPSLFGRGGVFDVSRNRVWRSVIDEDE